MSETIVIPEGNRVTVAGKRYKIDEQTVTNGSELSYKVQTNQHLQLVCPVPECVALQIERHPQSKPFTVRGTKVLDGPTVADLNESTARPLCGVCGVRMVWQVAATDPTV